MAPVPFLSAIKSNNRPVALSSKVVHVYRLYYGEFIYEYRLFIDVRFCEARDSW